LTDGVVMQGSACADFPVLVIPGYGAPAAQTELVSRNLRDAGLDTVKLKLPWMGMGDIPRSAGLLADSVARVRDSLGIDKVSLFGFSLGGVIASYYLQEMEGYPLLGRGAFVSVPYAGTYFGYLGFFSAAGRQIRPTSQLIKRLNDTRVAEIAGKCLSIYVRWDGVVVPSESAYMPDGYNLRRDRPISHWRSVTNRELILTAAEFLRGGLPEGAVPGHELAVPVPVKMIFMPSTPGDGRRHLAQVMSKPFKSFGSKVATLFRRKG